MRRDALGDADDRGRRRRRPPRRSRRRRSAAARTPSPCSRPLARRRRRRCRRPGCRRRPGRPCPASRRRRLRCRSRGCAVAWKRALAAGDALHDEPRLGVDEDRPSGGRLRQLDDALARRRASCARRARSAAPASASSWRPSTSFVPSSRTTIGTRRRAARAPSRMPRATSSQRVMPPKMLKRIARTLASESDAPRARSRSRRAWAPPPTSRKLAGRAAGLATTSSVDITRPAPLPRMPTVPSSLT